MMQSRRRIRYEICNRNVYFWSVKRFATKTSLTWHSHSKRLLTVFLMMSCKIAIAFKAILQVHFALTHILRLWQLLVPVSPDHCHLADKQLAFAQEETIRICTQLSWLSCILLVILISQQLREDAWGNSEVPICTLARSAWILRFVRRRLINPWFCTLNCILEMKALPLLHGVKPENFDLVGKDHWKISLLSRQHKRVE